MDSGADTGLHPHTVVFTVEVWARDASAAPHEAADELLDPTRDPTDWPYHVLSGHRNTLLYGIAGPQLTLPGTEHAMTTEEEKTGAAIARVEEARRQLRKKQRKER